MNEKKQHLVGAQHQKRQQSVGIANSQQYQSVKNSLQMSAGDRTFIRNSFMNASKLKNENESMSPDCNGAHSNDLQQHYQQFNTSQLKKQIINNGKKLKINRANLQSQGGNQSFNFSGQMAQNIIANGGMQMPPQIVSSSQMNTQTNVNLKSARRYQLMNQSNNQSISKVAGQQQQQVIQNQHAQQLQFQQQQILPSHALLSPQNIHTGQINQFQASPQMQTLNFASYKNMAAGMQHQSQKPSLSMDRAGQVFQNEVVIMSPMSSDTNSSINSLDQTLRLRIGGSIPKGINQNSSSLSGQIQAFHGGVQISNGLNGSGVPLNHFYQTASLTRDGIAYSSHHQQQLSQNFNSLDYSDSGGLQQRFFNDSSSLNAQANNQSAAQVSSSVKRNNFLSNPQNNQDEQSNDHAILSPESKSQPNPPTLRKITLNQRILQKNMMRISQNNIQAQPNQQQLQAQHINQNNSLEDMKHSKLQMQTVTLRNKKFSQPKVLQNVNQMFANQQFQLQQIQSQFDPSQNNTLDAAASNPQAQLQQTIQKIYIKQRKEGVINYSQQQQKSAQQAPLQNQTIDQTSISQLKRKHIKIKKSFIQSQDLANQLTLTLKNNNTNKSSNIPQLNLSSISQENAQSSNSKQQQQVAHQYINQGTVASARRHQIKVDSQRKQINMTQQEQTSTLSNNANNNTQLSTLQQKNSSIAQPQKLLSSFQQVQQQQQQPIIQLSNRSNKSNNVVQEQETTSHLLGQQLQNTYHSHQNQQQQQQTPGYSHRETAISKTISSARQEVDSQHQNNSSQQRLLNQIQNQSSNESIRLEDVQFPITPGRTLKYFKHQLTQYEQTEILDYPQIYYIGQGASKVRGSAQNEFNYGFDDKKGNYKIVLKDHIGYRYEVLQFLGKGSFGIALKCFDHKLKIEVAVKVIKNKKKYYYQAGVELKILQYLKENDPDDTMNIIHMYDYVIFRKHLCISFELMSINLYDFLKLNDFEGLSLGLVRRFAIQLLYALKYLKEHHVIHCDLKPENILLKDPTKSGIKIIDFGSSCFQDERVYTYIQSRFYRAPEIILGIPYTTSIDMWSFGCIMAEFCIGYPLFPGEDEMEQLSMIMEVCGIPSQEVLAVSQRKKKFFDDSNAPILVQNTKGQVRRPGTKIIEDILDCRDDSFVNFVERCLDWNPETRLTPDKALRHPWILEGLPPKVLIHHQKLHNIPTSELPPNIREIRRQYLLKEQGLTEQQINEQKPQETGLQSKQLRGEPRKSNNQVSSKRKQSIEQQKQIQAIGQIVSQSQENQHPQNIISPRTKKIALQSQDQSTLMKQQMLQNSQINPQPQISSSITSAFVPLKQQSSNNTTIDSSKILESTLRNRKILIPQGVKRSAENNVNGGNQPNNESNFSKGGGKSGNYNGSLTIIQSINQQPANEQAHTNAIQMNRKQML